MPEQVQTFFISLPGEKKVWAMHSKKISTLESNKWSNHKIKAHYNDFDTNYV